MSDAQTMTRTITQADLDGFAQISGDDNPIHVDPEFAARTPFRVPVAHGMFLFSLVRAELRRRWPVARLAEQRLMFTSPTPVGATVTIRLQTLETWARQRRVSTTVVHPGGSIGLQGEALLEWPEDAS